MSLPPANIATQDAGLENWDIRSQEIRTEEQERLAQTEARFRETPEYSQLSAVVEDKSILNAIVAAYAEAGEDLEQAIRIVFTDTTTTTRLGLKFNSPNDGMQAAEALIGEMKNGNQEIEEGKASDVPEQESTSEQDEAGIEQEEIDVDEIPGMPTLRRLSENGTISPEYSIGITTQVEQGETLTNSISSVITDAGQREEILSFFQVEEPEKRAEKFFKDMPDIVSADEGHPTLQLIAENYTQIPGIDGKEASAEENFKTAAQEAANKVVDGKVFERTEGFQRAMDTIKSGSDKEAMFIALGEVHQYVNNYTGTRGKAGKEKLRLAQQRKAQAEMAQEITFGELIATAKENANAEQQARIQKAMEARQAEASDTIDTGEGGLGGDILDIVSETNNQNQKVA